MDISRFKKSFKGDLSGGVTAAIISIPLGLGFGVVSGLGAEAGIYTAVLLSIVAAIVGGTQTLISDPTAPMTFVAAGIISTVGAGETGLDDSAMGIIVLTFALAGMLQFLFGFLKVAQYVKYIPYPVISGFMGGIGVIIMIGQLFALLGHAEGAPKGAINVFSQISEPLSNINYAALGLGLGTIAIIYLIPLVSKKIPAVLVALIVMTVLSILLLEPDAIERVGEIDAGVPLPKIDLLFSLELGDLAHVLGPAITLAALGTIDTLLTSVVADNLTKTQHKGDRELKGQGIGNFIVALFGGIPGAGSTTGTVINIRSGATTQMSGIIKGVFLLLVVLLLADYVQYIPSSVLGGILFTIGIGIIDVKGLKLLLRVPRAESFILILTLFVTVFDTLLHAVALGALMAVVVFMKKMSEVVEQLNKEGELKSFTRDESIPDDLLNKVYVKRLDGPMFFGFADQFRNHIKSIHGFEAMILDMKRVPFMDETGLLTLEDAISDLHARGINVYITGANESIYEQLQKVNIPGNLVPEDHFYPFFKHCVKRLKFQYENSQKIE